MAVGGQVNQSGGGGGVLSSVAQYWPALNGALERNKTLALANQEKQLEFDQKKAIGSDVAATFGGFDPKTGINWNTGRQGPSGDTQTQINPGFDTADGRVDPVYTPHTAATKADAYAGNPFSSTLNDPMTAMVAKWDPKGVLSNVMTQAFAPPKTYQVTLPTGETRSQLLTSAQAQRLQAQGAQIALSDNAKPVDPNTAPTQFKSVDPKTGREATSLWRPGTGQPQQYGGLGDFAVKPPPGPLGELLGAERFATTFGGGQTLDGHRGSGAPNQGTIPQAPQGGAGVVQTPANQPTPAAPVYDRVAATDHDVTRRPWLQPVTPTSSNQPAANGGIPSMANIFQQKMIQAGRSPEEQARLNKQAENTVAPFDYDQKEREKNAKLTQAYESATQGADQTVGIIDTLLDPNNDEGLEATTGFGGTWLGKQMTMPGRGFGRTPGIGTSKGLFPSDMAARESQLEAKSFLEGLASLKSQSATGASGLGAVSETEGNRVIQAQAALDRAQTKENYAAALDNFRQALRQAKENVRKAYEAEIGGGSSGGGWKIERVN